jgi:hypothetical protein
VSKGAEWLKGEKVGEGKEKTGVIIVVEKEGGVLDVFYFYFFAFNWGGVVLDKQLGATSSFLPFSCFFRLLALG